jgi:transcriptional regulator with PAS, ATPase and Fis domain
LQKYGTSTQEKKVVAMKLGIGIATLYRKIEEYDLSK